MTRTRMIGLASACAAVLLALALWRGLSDAGGTPQSAAAAFLGRYVDGDGRVVRIDQGGDTVSEGQAYGMLLAAAAGQPRTFAAVWGWTRENLQRRDGLLAWRWEDGRVTETSSAADADLDAAWALVLAARRFEEPRYRAAGLRLGDAILARETVEVAGRPVLVAGDWAQRAPAVVNPSYFAPAAFAALSTASGDPRWRALSENSTRIVSQLTERASGLPPDWAVVRADGSAAAAAPPGGRPGGASTPEFGYDAVRVPLWLDSGCGAQNQGVAARSAEFLAGAAGSGGHDRYGLDGEPRGGPDGAPLLVAAAAASSAAGNHARARELIAGAEAVDHAEPTYYGGALVALARESSAPDGELAC